MEPLKGSNEEEEEDRFVEAQDELPPLNDCNSEWDLPIPPLPFTSPETPRPDASIRRRPLSSRGMSGKDVQSSSPDASSIESSITRITDSNTFSEIENHDRKGNGEEECPSGSTGSHITAVPEIESSVGETENEESTLTTADDDTVGETVEEGSVIRALAKPNGTRVEITPSEFGFIESHALAEPNNPSSTNMLVLLAGLVIKAIGFQFNLFISLIKLPTWVLYYGFIFVIDPFRTVRLGGVYLTKKIFDLGNMICGNVCSLMSEKLMENKSVWKLAIQIGWGLFWAIYVCFILCALLVSSLIAGGFIMRYLVEEPIMIKDALNFDYTKNSPEAFVPVLPGACCGLNCKESYEVEKKSESRVIPANHDLRVIVTLILPESQYNRNLGMFQVRVDFLSANGQVLASSRHPCMLKFKSEPIRYFLTLLKVVPLVAGYVSESQTLELKIKTFTEKHVPSACLKVIIEQRAEFRPASGIPEVYDASVILESELPFFKRIIWYWKKTLYIWISMMLLAVELMCALVCCRPLVLPRTRQRDRSPSNNTDQNTRITEIVAERD